MCASIRRRRHVRRATRDSGCIRVWSAVCCTVLTRHFVFGRDSFRRCAGARETPPHRPYLYSLVIVACTRRRLPEVGEVALLIPRTLGILRGERDVSAAAASMARDGAASQGPVRTAELLQWPRALGGVLTVTWPSRRGRRGAVAGVKTGRPHRRRAVESLCVFEEVRGEVERLEDEHC